MARKSLCTCFTVLPYAKLTLTAPFEERYLCISGEQCRPLLTAKPRSFNASATVAESIPLTLKDTTPFDSTVEYSFMFLYIFKSVYEFFRQFFFESVYFVKMFFRPLNTCVQSRNCGGVQRTRFLRLRWS